MRVLKCHSIDPLYGCEDPKAFNGLLIFIIKCVHSDFESVVQS